MNFKLVEAFYWTFKLGSISSAAQHLYVTQSALSKRLFEFERSSRTKLFYKTGYDRVLTQHGIEAFNHCEKILIMINELDSYKNTHTTIARTIHIGITELVAVTWFHEFVKKTKNVYPQLLLHPDVDMANRLRKKLLRGEIDIAIVPAWFVDPMMHSVEIISVDFSWFAPCNQFNYDPVPVQDLVRKLPVIIQGPESGITERYERLFAHEKIERTTVFGSDSLFPLVSLVEAGVGVSCLPKNLFAKNVLEGRMQMVNTVPHPEAVSYYATFLKNGRSSSLGYHLAQIAVSCAFE